MDNIYDLIQQHPVLFAWAFGLVNFLWGFFIYFNKQSHDKTLAKLKNDLSLDADRRKKVFELKASQYKAYVSNLDAFGKKHQVDLPQRMQPIFDKYLNDYLAASEQGDKIQERNVITWFSGQISGLMQEGLADVLKLKSESNRLKLTATEEMINTFNELESLTKKSMDTANEFMSKFPDIIISQNNELSKSYQEKLKILSEKTEKSANCLMEQMRAELNKI